MSKPILVILLLLFPIFLRLSLQIFLSTLHTRSQSGHSTCVDGAIGRSTLRPTTTLSRSGGSTKQILTAAAVSNLMAFSSFQVGPLAYVVLLVYSKAIVQEGPLAKL